MNKPVNTPAQLNLDLILNDLKVQHLTNNMNNAAEIPNHYESLRQNKNDVWANMIANSPNCYLGNPEKDTAIEGVKYDADKPRLDLIPPETLMALGEILSIGAKKYNDRNWEKGMSWGRVFGALMRHLWAWWSGQDTDPETGKPHLWHGIACLSFLLAYEQRRIGVDDRHKTKA